MTGLTTVFQAEVARLFFSLPAAMGSCWLAEERSSHPGSRR